jgi:hypothetical protein
MIHAELCDFAELEHTQSPGSVAHGGAVADEEFQLRPVRRCCRAGGPLSQVYGNPLARLGE